MTEPDPTQAHPPAGTSPNPTEAYPALDSASELVRVLDQYLADLQAGRAPNRAELLARHPELASQIEQCLDGIEFIHRAARPGADAPTRLGDFRIEREIGRGGMGVVYQAEQLSLRRPVALKVLRFGGGTDTEALERFRREAETVVHLHHTNIVPIFAVGAEQGVHYYAMQFIESRSLAAVLEEARQEPRHLPPAEVARWGLQAAEALAYAHQRGVIHRDVKPSNLLLDHQGTVWLTDFGLARRADEVTLTATGMLLGTPRYMSPEQAGALQQPVDHRSDVFSLGATLYELATARPAFDGDTPQKVIAQILQAEPAPPRRLRPDLPRDLETVLLKCLDKDPARRYASAQQLADDLRRFLNGDPIKARRPSWAERTVRWARKQRRSVVVSAATAAAAFVLLAGAWLAWQGYVEWRQGKVLLTTKGPPLEAEVFDDREQPVLPPFTVPTRQPVPLPAGLYHLRLSAPGRLSETYQLLVEQGVQQSFEVGRNDRDLWGPVEVSKGFEVVDLDGHPDVILVTEKELRRVEGATGKEVWRRSMDKRDQPAVAAIKDYDWRQLSHAWFGPPNADLPWGVRPWPARPAPDLDGDGTRDLAWACRGQPWLLAVSGKDGTVKWWFRSQRPPGPEGPTGGSVCPPIAEDVDRDGRPDLIATFGDERNPTCPQWVEAVSGRTGRPIWRYTFERESQGQPPDPREEDRFRETRFAAAVTRVGDRRLLVVVAGRRLVQLDPRTGKPVGSVRDLGFEPLEPPVFADLNGDGQLALLLLQGRNPEDLTLTAVSPATGPLWRHRVGQTAAEWRSPMPPFLWPVVEDLDGDGKPEVIVPYNHKGAPDMGVYGWVGVEVLDGATGQSRWRRRLSRALGGSAEVHGMAHFLVGPDLDGDGPRDVFTATLIEGLTDNGERDRNVRLLLVAANSGADGHTLWTSLTTVSENAFRSRFDELGPLGWWQAGPDGRPLLAVTCLGLQFDPAGQKTVTAKDRVAQTFLVSSATGKVEHTWPGFFNVDAVDFNADGIPELYGLRPNESAESGQLHVLRGGPPETSRRLGDWQTAITSSLEVPGSLTRYVAPLLHGDLDGDGMPDILVFHPADARGIAEAPPLQAYSGKDGHRLWKVDALKGATIPDTFISECFRLECRDLEGAGRPVVLFAYRLGKESSRQECWLAALSGRNGKVLWKEHLGGGERKDATGSAFSVGCPEWLARQQPGFGDLNHDGVLDVVILAQGNHQQPELRALDGRDGRLLWNQSLSTDVHSYPVRFLVGQPDGNGLVDVVVVSQVERCGPPPQDPTHGTPVTTRIQLSARDGTNGQEKWVWSGPEQTSSVGLAPPVLADLEGDGRRSVCLPVYNQERHTMQILIVDPPGRLRQTVTVERPSVFRLWSCDLKGDGKEELLFVGDGKVRALGGRLEKPLWKWPLTNDLRGILDIQPADQEHPAVVVVWSNNVAYGLDAPTGRLRWRCDGPGLPTALLAGGGASGLPSVQFHVSEPEITISRQAVPVGPDGKYRPPVPASRVYESPTVDPWEIISLPWEYQGRHRMMQALVPGLACLGLLVYFALHRKWQVTIGLLICFFVIPPVIAGFELMANHKFAEQHYAWGGWYWLWPYLLGAPLGLTLLKSPLLWMLAWLLWLRWGLGAPARKRTPPGRCSEEQRS